MDSANPQLKSPCPNCGRLIDAAAAYCSFCGKPVTSSPPPPGAYGAAPPAPMPRAARRPSAGQCACISIAVIVTFVAFIGIMLALTLPNYLRVKEKAREAEAKANLHGIQQAVEQYAVDHGGSYPQYLIGGEGRAAASVDASRPDSSAFQAIVDCPTPSDVADPLLAGGYLTEYPRNPFVRSGLAIHQVQENLPSAEFDGCDPLRNATAEGAKYGTRFGAECNLMGSVLADPRYRVQGTLGPPPAGATGERTYADIEYDFWDMWTGNKPRPFLPGQFFYKSMGPIVSGAAQEPNAVFPTEIDQYMLGVYGGIRTKGKDILGAEQPVPGGQRAASAGGAQTAALNDFWCMTRSQVSNDLSKCEGSPFSISINPAGNEIVKCGNPNGIRDALILILTAGG